MNDMRKLMEAASRLVEGDVVSFEKPKAKQAAPKGNTLGTISDELEGSWDMVDQKIVKDNMILVFQDNGVGKIALKFPLVHFKQLKTNVAAKDIKAKWVDEESELDWQGTGEELLAKLKQALAGDADDPFSSFYAESRTSSPVNEATLDNSIFYEIAKKLKKIPELKVRISSKKIRITGPAVLDVYVEGELYRDKFAKEPWVNFETNIMSGNDPASQFYWTALSAIADSYVEMLRSEPDEYEDEGSPEEYWREAGITRKHCLAVVKYLDPEAYKHGPARGWD